jgi:hypothetical protein
VSRTAVHTIALGAFAAAGLGAALLVSPGAPALTVEIYLFVVAALVLAAVLLNVTNALPRSEPVPLQQPPRTQRVGQLESVARALDLAEASSFDLHNTLRPIVREIAAARLASHGVSLERQPERARALVGAQTWELVRPDREAPAGRSGSGGCSRDELRLIVDSLEAI